MNRMRQLGMYGYEPWQEDRERTHANAWVPAADVFAKGKDLIIRLALAGVKRDDIELTLQDNVLTVSGERRRDLDDEEVSFYVHELYYGVFRRSMTLPSGIDESKISAEFDNGLMEITVQGGAATAEPRGDLEARLPQSHGDPEQDREHRHYVYGLAQGAVHAVAEQGPEDRAYEAWLVPAEAEVPTTSPTIAYMAHGCSVQWKKEYCIATRAASAVFGCARSKGGSA
jgi:HSP20 family protein